MSPFTASKPGSSPAGLSGEPLKSKMSRMLLTAVTPPIAMSPMLVTRRS
jgi:hypothetical protein